MSLAEYQREVSPTHHTCSFAVVLDDMGLEAQESQMTTHHPRLLLSYPCGCDINMTLTKDDAACYCLSGLAALWIVCLTVYLEHQTSFEFVIGFTTTSAWSCVTLDNKRFSGFYNSKLLNAQVALQRCKLVIYLLHNSAPLYWIENWQLEEWKKGMWKLLACVVLYVCTWELRQNRSWQRLGRDSRCKIVVDERACYMYVYI